MSDVELIFAILAVIYGWECACWLRGGTLAFRTFLGRVWRAVPPGKLLGNQHGGFIFANPLPPFGTLLQSGAQPVSVSPKGVLAYVATNLNPGPRPWQSGRWVPFEQMQTVRVKGKWVLANGERLVHAGSAHSAVRLAELLKSLKTTQHEKRERQIRDFSESCFDSRALDQSWQSLRQHSRKLRWLTNGLFLYVFLIAPLVIRFAGFRLSWIGLLIGLLAMASSIAVLFQKAHRQLYPKLEDERFTQFIIVLLSPANSIRALDLLSRPALEAFHPLALAKKFFIGARFEAFAAQCLRDLRHPAGPELAANDPAAQDAERWFRQLQLESVEKFLSRHGTKASRLALAPVRPDPGCLAYCPRCLSQFTVSCGMCEDCGGLPLVRFDAAGNDRASEQNLN